MMAGNEGEPKGIDIQTRHGMLKAPTFGHKIHSAIGRQFSRYGNSIDGSVVVTGMIALAGSQLQVIEMVFEEVAGVHLIDLDLHRRLIFTEATIAAGAISYIAARLISRISPRVQQ